MTVSATISLTIMSIFLFLTPAFGSILIVRGSRNIL